MKNARGFEIQHFLDDYGLDCSIQESSSVEPHVWLGVHNPPHKVMWDSAGKYGIEIGEKEGWYDYPIPEEVLVESRMHLSRKQAKALAKKLRYFAKHGVLKEERA